MKGICLGKDGGGKKKVDRDKLVEVGLGNNGRYLTDDRFFGVCVKKLMTTN